MAHESGPRMNVSSARQSRGLKGWAVNKGNDPRNSVGVDKHCKRHQIGRSPKISKEKAATTALNALQLTL